MPLRLDIARPDFGERFADLLAMQREVSEDVDNAVRDIIADVRARGDAALIDYSQRFDRVDLKKLGIAVAADEIARAEADCEPEVLAALDFAHARIR
jgi:histidinol dehydrogenase